MRGYLKTLLEWVHLVLLFTIAVPALALYSPDFGMQTIYPLYIASFLLVVPIISLKTAASKCRHWYSYVIIVVLVCMGVDRFADIIAKRYLEESVWFHYVSWMFLISLILAIECFRVRILNARRQNAKKAHDRTWEDAYITLDKPKRVFAVWFLVLYVLAKFTVSPQVCNLAAVSLILYLAVASVYVFLEKNENYLKMNEKLCNVRNIPHKRIYGIGRMFLLIYIGLLLLILIPAILTSGSRTYYDIRQWGVNVPIEAVEPQMNNMMGDIGAYLPVEGETTELTEIMNVIFVICGVVILVVAVFFLVKGILAELRMFAEGMQQEEDKIESLQEEEEEERVFKTNTVDGSGKEPRIRKVYRKYIRKHRKQRPAVYETPREIELAAGVADTPEGQRLHEEYELVRYGKIEN